MRLVFFSLGVPARLLLLLLLESIVLPNCPEAEADLSLPDDRPKALELRALVFAPPADEAGTDDTT